MRPLGLLQRADEQDRRSAPRRSATAIASARARRRGRHGPASGAWTGRSAGTGIGTGKRSCVTSTLGTPRPSSPLSSSGNRVVLARAMRTNMPSTNRIRTVAAVSQPPGMVPFPNGDGTGVVSKTRRKRHQAHDERRDQQGMLGDEPQRRAAPQQQHGRQDRDSPATATGSGQARSAPRCMPRPPGSSPRIEPMNRRVPVGEAIDVVMVHAVSVSSPPLARSARPGILSGPLLRRSPFRIRRQRGGNPDP